MAVEQPHRGSEDELPVPTDDFHACHEMLVECEWNRREERVMSTPRYGLQKWGVKVGQQIPQKRLARWQNRSGRNATPASDTHFVPPRVYRLTHCFFHDSSETSIMRPLQTFLD